jgi:class 3 adenylate cyclase
VENPISGTKMTMDATYPFVAVLAAGISNCSRLHEKLEGSEASRVVDRCLKRIERSVDAIGGRIVQTGSGEVIAIFDAADAVVHAAIEMQQRIANLPPVSGVKMAIRVGISCGLASNPDQPVDDGLVRETARLMGIAQSGHALAHVKIREALPEAMQRMVTRTDLMLANESGHNEPVMKIAPVEASAADSAKNGSPDAAGSAEAWLRLTYGLDTVVLNEHKPVIVMGRDAACEVIIRNPRASRRHATIQRRGSLIVLIDRSTNGTFVTIDGDPTQFVRHGECPLHGIGVIAFSSKSSTIPDTDCIRFECA